MMCSATWLLIGWRKASGTVPTISNLSDSYSRAAYTLVSTTAERDRAEVGGALTAASSATRARRHRGPSVAGRGRSSRWRCANRDHRAPLSAAGRPSPSCSSEPSHVRTRLDGAATGAPAAPRRARLDPPPEQRGHGPPRPRPAPYPRALTAHASNATAWVSLLSAGWAQCAWASGQERGVGQVGPDGDHAQRIFTIGIYCAAAPAKPKPKRMRTLSWVVMTIGARNWASAIVGASPGHPGCP